MRNFVIMTFLIVTTTAVCGFYVPDENLTDDPGTGDLLDPQLDPETQFNDGEPMILIRNKRARFDSFYGSSIDSGESPSQLYYQPVFRYRQTKKKRRRLFVPNLWG